MESNERCVKTGPPSGWVWGERVVTLLSGAALSFVASLLVYGVSEPIQMKSFLIALQPAPMLIAFVPYFVIAVVLVAGPGLDGIHKAAMFLGIAGLAVACPIVGWVFLLRGVRALQDPGFLFAGLAAMFQAALIISASRLSEPADQYLTVLCLVGEARPELPSGDESRSVLWLFGLAALALGLIILIPLLALMILGAGM
jgi:hypothetical protein